MTDHPPRPRPSIEFPRRKLLRLAGGGAALAALAALPGCSSRDDGGEDASPGTPTSTPRSGATTYPEPGPAVLRSTNGVLKATLQIAPATVAHQGGRRWVLAVNGRSPGPTLRVKPGDRLELTLDNQIGDSTNLHTHGLRVSPAGNADNPFIEIKAGEKFDYRIDIPADHPGGTFWYHPHWHHHVAEQLFSGFFGMIIVEDAVDALPEMQAATERLIALHDTRIGASREAVMAANMMEMRQGREGVVFVSGEQKPTYKAEAGKLERWRILNASPSRFYRLKLDGHQMFLIATDADRLAAPRPQDEIRMAPGERVEVLVRPATAGSYRLRSLPISRGAMGGKDLSNPEFDVLALEVSGSAPAAAMPGALVPLEDLSKTVARRSRDVVFSMQGQMGGAMFLIDGKQFDIGRVDIRVEKDTVEDWVVRNTSPMDHPFHLHIWPFQVIESSAGPVVDRAWKDTVNVPANSWLRLRIPFTGLTGKTVFHCHILDHEDMGMMAVVEVA